MKGQIQNFSFITPINEQQNPSQPYNKGKRKVYKKNKNKYKPQPPPCTVIHGFCILISALDSNFP